MLLDLFLGNCILICVDIYSQYMLIMNNRSSSSNMYRMVETEDRGKVLLATKRLDPGLMGLEVFKEEALLAIPTRGSALDKSGPVPTILEAGPQMWTDWWFYKKQPEEIRQRVLAMYNELDCLPANVLREYLLKMGRLREE